MHDYNVQTINSVIIYLTAEVGDCIKSDKYVRCIMISINYIHVTRIFTNIIAVNVIKQ